jgi:hypothetical protein
MRRQSSTVTLRTVPFRHSYSGQKLTFPHPGEATSTGIEWPRRRTRRAFSDVQALEHRNERAATPEWERHMGGTHMELYRSTAGRYIGEFDRRL